MPITDQWSCIGTLQVFLRMFSWNSGTRDPMGWSIILLTCGWFCYFQHFHVCWGLRTSLWMKSMKWTSTKNCSDSNYVWGVQHLLLSSFTIYIYIYIIPSKLIRQIYRLQSSFWSFCQLSIPSRILKVFLPLKMNQSPNYGFLTLWLFNIAMEMAHL